MIPADSLLILNSMTKYPSIPTLHGVDEKANLLDSLNLSLPDTDLVFQEKVDGTNIRIIATPFGIILGSRDHLLCGWDDQGHRHDFKKIYPLSVEGHIVAQMPGLWGHLGGARLSRQDTPVVVVYGELYGGNLPARKNYAADGSWGFRIFDVSTIDDTTFDRLWQETHLVKVSSWRQRQGPAWLAADRLGAFAHDHALQTVPFLEAQPPSELTIAGIHDWLEAYAGTRCALTEGAENHSEGVIIRTADRSFICKLRVESYESGKRYRERRHAAS